MSTNLCLSKIRFPSRLRSETNVLVAEVLQQNMWLQQIRKYKLFVKLISGVHATCSPHPLPSAPSILETLDKTLKDDNSEG